MGIWGKCHEGFVGSTFPRFTVAEAKRELGTAGDGATRPLVSDGSLVAGWIERSCSTSHEARTKTSGSLPGEGAGFGGRHAFESERREANLDENSAGLRCFKPRAYKTCRPVSRGDVVAIERPLAAIQLSAAMPWVIACPGCLRHIGNLDLQLAVASGTCCRAQALEYLHSRSSEFGATVYQERLRDTEEVQEAGRGVDETEDGDAQGASSSYDGRHLPMVPGLSERFSQVPVSCSGGCGALYCSEPCWRRCWELGHSVLCLGLVDDEEHPLVMHKIHALSHPDLEAPLLMAAQLLIQAALAIKKTRGLSSPRSREVSHIAEAFSGYIPFDQLLEKINEMARFGAEVEAPCSGSNSELGDGNGVARNHGYGHKLGGLPSRGTNVCGIYRHEADAVLELLDALPRGLFRAESSRTAPEAVVAESWKLLREGLARRARRGDVKPVMMGMMETKEDLRREDPECAEVIDMEGFPVLMSYSVYSVVVAGLAANLLDVEVRSPLVDYCEALAILDSDIQGRALQVLEPVLGMMDEDSHEFDDSLDGTQEVRTETKLEGVGVAVDGEHGLKLSSADADEFEANRATARLAWRCVEAGRIAGRLVPALVVKALLPHAAALPHSCTPVLQAPAPHPRSKSSAELVQGTGPRTGAAGWPLAVAFVALRDVHPGSILSSTWIDEEAELTERREELMTFAHLHVSEASQNVGCSRSERECAEEQKGSSHQYFVSGIAKADPEGCNNGGTAFPRRDSPCGCAKCEIESATEDGAQMMDLEELLDAAKAAVDQYRFDDALFVLNQARDLAPSNGDVFYRAGIVSIHLGDWSRALRFWREGLVVAPSHPQLVEEAEKYDALDFWLDDDVDGERSNGPFALGTSPPSSPSFGDEMESSAGSEWDVGPDNLNVTIMSDGEWICDTRRPPLSGDECAAIIAEAEAVAADAVAAAAAAGERSRNGGWGTSRHYSVPTTDVAVRDLPSTLAWFKGVMRTRIAPLVASAVALGKEGMSRVEEGDHSHQADDGGDDSHDGGEDSHDDGDNSHDGGEGTGEGRGRRGSPNSSCCLPGERSSEASADRADASSAWVRGLRVHDAFVVRYDSAAQRSLPLHTDQGDLSLTIALNHSDAFEGGGTWFEGLGRAIRPAEAGNVVVFPGGETVHGGQEITRGIRYILAVFLYVCQDGEEPDDEQEVDGL